MRHVCISHVLVHSCNYVLDRADAQLEVSTLGSYLRASTTGAVEAVRRVTRYLLGTQGAYVKLRIQTTDPATGNSDSDWAGDPASRKSQSSGHLKLTDVH